MNRRASLPGADELFRPTGGKVSSRRGDTAPPTRAPGASAAAGREGGRASGRTTHDEKITVYLSQQELIDLEQARLRLRAEFGLHVDRGRIVREALALLLADLHSRGPDAAVVRNLT